jgi:hypothetical protein
MISVAFVTPIFGEGFLKKCGQHKQKLRCFSFFIFPREYQFFSHILSRNLKGKLVN